MRTNIVLDDGLVDQAFRHTSAKTKRELVHLALQEFVQNHGRLDIRDLKGRVSFCLGYDHRKLRNGR